jgi:hypothetical protein
MNTDKSAAESSSKPATPAVETRPAPPPPTPKKSSLVATAILMIVGGVIGYAASRFGSALLPMSALGKQSPLDLVVIFLMLPIAFFMAIVVHELGHLVGALANGFRFRVLTLGPWSILSTNSGFKHRLSWSVMSMLGGQQISAPPLTGATDRQYIIYLLGGGVANIVTGSVVLALVYTLTMPLWLTFFGLFFALLSLLLGPINLFPMMMTTGVSTDGYHIRSLRRGGAAARQFRAMFQFLSDVYGGVRPRDWKPDMVETLAHTDATGYERMLGQVVSMQYAMDKGNWLEMDKPVENIVAGYETIPQAIRPHFAVELAYYFAVYKGDAKTARRYANDLVRDAYLISASALHRGWAAAHFAEGDYDKAEREIEKGLAVINDATTELDRLMEQELLINLRGRIASKRSFNATQGDNIAAETV